MNNRNYQICTKCILDTVNDPFIVFDEQGVCNHCRNYEQLAKQYAIPEEEKKKRLNEIVAKIKQDGKGKKYDSILGISGGIDSSYLAYIAKQLGLNPLVAHFDNGWNSELAVKNIETIINKLGFDLYTYVVDWEEFKDLQLSYIKASVIDWEIPTDHGFYAMLYHLAYKHKIKYILAGYNIVTEGILPKYMRWSKMDVANIKAIHKKYGTIKLRTFPMLDFFTYFYYMHIKKIQLVSPLNYVHYNRSEAKQKIQEELGWRDYGGKHYESVFTRFYQGYVLVEKFKIDKRRAHLSTLINSGQISREQALEEIKKPPYDLEQLKIDKEYVIKKLGLTHEEFEKYMQQPVRSHLDFPSYETGMYRYHEKFFKTIKPVTKLIKKIF